MAADFFLNIEGIKGESIHAQHRDEIEIASFSWGATQLGTSAGGGGGGAGKVSMQDFHFVMRTNSASPKLFLFCVSGQDLLKAVLTCRKSGDQKSGGDQQPFLKWTLSEVFVTSYQTGGSGGDEGPMDQFSLSAARVEVEYRPQTEAGKPKAPVTAAWDFKASK